MRVNQLVRAGLLVLVLSISMADTASIDKKLEKKIRGSMTHMKEKRRLVTERQDPGDGKGANVPNGTDGSANAHAEIWNEESLSTCCAYTRLEGKRLLGSNVMRPRNTLADAQDVCDALDKCRGVVMLGNGTGIPEAYRNKFALKSSDEMVDAPDNGTVLYSKSDCKEMQVCNRTALQEPLQNASNASSATGNITTSCVTRKDDRVGPGWLTSLAPVGTPCMFGVDSRDEGKHCIHQDDQFGSFGWCYTKKDKSAWGSCTEECPLIGHFRILGDKLDDLTAMVDDLISNKGGGAGATNGTKGNGTDGTAPGEEEVESESQGSANKTDADGKKKGGGPQAMLLHVVDKDKGKHNKQMRGGSSGVGMGKTPRQHRRKTQTRHQHQHQRRHRSRSRSRPATFYHFSGKVPRNHEH